MAGSIVESLTNLLGPQVLNPLASQLGESTDTVQRGLQGGAAAMLAGIAAKAHEPGFLGQIFGLVTNPANNAGALSSITSNVTSLASGAGNSSIADLGSRFVSTIFGSGQATVTDSVARASGLSAGKMGTLLSMAAPMVLGVLGQHVRQNGLTASGLGDAVKAEAPGLQRFLPAGFGSLLGGATNFATAAPAAVAGAANRWLWPVLLLVAAVIAIIWFFNRAKAPVSNAVNSGVAALGNFYKTKLPNGVELNIPQFGIESKLIAFLGDSSKPVDSTTWFNFDRLLFDTGQATLQPSSQEQLNNIAEILKAFPQVQVKIGGYTDNTGDQTANMSLSTARAKNVMDALVTLGIDPTRLSSQGYGEQYPVADNSTEAGRAQNRRIALRVTQK